MGIKKTLVMASLAATSMFGGIRGAFAETEGDTQNTTQTATSSFQVTPEEHKTNSLDLKKEEERRKRVQEEIRQDWEEAALYWNPGALRRKMLDEQNARREKETNPLIHLSYEAYKGGSNLSDFAKKIGWSKDLEDVPQEKGEQDEANTVSGLFARKGNETLYEFGKRIDWADEDQLQEAKNNERWVESGYLNAKQRQTKEEVAKIVKESGDRNEDFATFALRVGWGKDAGFLGNLFKKLGIQTKGQQRIEKYSEIFERRMVKDNKTGENRPESLEEFRERMDIAFSLSHKYKEINPNLKSYLESESEKGLKGILSKSFGDYLLYKYQTTAENVKKLGARGVEMYYGHPFASAGLMALLIMYGLYKQDEKDLEGKEKAKPNVLDLQEMKRKSDSRS